ncbi:MAG TPA: L-fucose:H+ symporter permease [Pseudonocardiaceae bacterium]|nr:L-fucose:H+ symporter permease [Pseudonocardiaceae bacterium]
MSAIEQPAAASPATAQPDRTTHPLVDKNMIVLFAVVICCFTAWGIAADLTAPMVAAFKRIFTMSTFQASLVQFAYYGAYFALALPAAFINQWFGYKTGVLTGLGLAALGALLFYPASEIMTYSMFLAALFTLAAGLSILETSANPYVMSMGPEANSTRRLNLAQAFNPVGTNIGVLLATVLVLPKLNSPIDRASVTPEQLRAIQAEELKAVMVPYIGLAILLLVIWVAIAVQKAPTIREEFPPASPSVGSRGEIIGRLWRNRHYRYGVIAQFFNIAAQVCTWTFTIQYVEQALNGSLELGGFVLQISLLVFLGSRFLMTWLMGYFRATALMAMSGGLAVLLCIYAMFSPNLSGVIAVAALSFCLSLMFPTIYGVALRGLGPATKFGAAGLVMAIVGGALMPLVQGKVIDATSPAFSFIVPAVCYAVVMAYALYDLKAIRPFEHDAPEPVPAHT